MGGAGDRDADMCGLNALCLGVGVCMSGGCGDGGGVCGGASWEMVLPSVVWGLGPRADMRSRRARAERSAARLDSEAA